MIDSKYLSLIQVAELGSYTKAARELVISQPAVTMHIKQLEELYDTRLFERAEGRMVLTPAGEIVRKYAIRMQALENNLLQELDGEKNRIRSLNVGITHTAESSAIIEALAAYMGSRDNIALKILTNTTEKLLSMLKNYELDFAFVDRSISSHSLSFFEMDTDTLVLAAAPEHPLAGRQSVSLEELKEQRMILRLPESGTRNLFTASLESQNLSIRDYNIVIEIESIATIKDLIRRNFGVSVLAQSACMDEYKKGKLALLPIEGLNLERHTVIAARKDFEHPELIRGLVDYYHQQG